MRTPHHRFAAARILGLPLVLSTVIGLSTLTACSSTEEREGSGAPAITVPECQPAPKQSGGECLPNDESDALLDELIVECTFSKDAVTEAWTEEYGWIWWNPRSDTSTAAVGVDLETGESVCT
jgi:hypothetical protein